MSIQRRLAAAAAVTANLPDTDHPTREQMDAQVAAIIETIRGSNHDIADLHDQWIAQTAPRRRHNRTG